MELISGTFPGSLQIANELVYHPCGFHISNFTLHNESKAYDACSFTLNGKNIQYRIAKITPTKTGQFVTIWKRNEKGITVPFDISDNIHFTIIAVIKKEESGQFIFPTSVLADKNIITQNGKQGKRGIRVYPPWDEATSSHAKKTQAWQLKYFLSIKTGVIIQPGLVKQLFRNE